MSEPAFCYKCDDIVTFCGCDKSITTQEGALEYFKERIAALENKINMLEKIEVTYIEEIQDYTDRIIDAPCLYELIGRMEHIIKRYASEVPLCHQPEGLPLDAENVLREQR